MGSYFIFAIVLTVLYVIYYAVNIARDLYGKKESGKTDETVASPAAQGGDAEQEEETAHARFERLKAKAEERMEDSVPYLSDPFTSEEMYKAMVSRGCPENRPELKWKPVKDKL